MTIEWYFSKNIRLCGTDTLYVVLKKTRLLGISQRYNIALFVANIKI